VAGAIVGFRNATQVDALVQAGWLTLTDDDIRAIED
jgi:aryl-alcohol dehydrogenase-like predicted oxidoreductase